MRPVLPGSGRLCPGRRLDCIAVDPRMAFNGEWSTGPVASITIRSLDDDAKTRPCDSVGRETPPRNLAGAIRARTAPLGGVDLELPPRGPGREPPSFD